MLYEHFYQCVVSLYLQNDPQVCLYYSTLFQLDQPDIGNTI